MGYDKHLAMPVLLSKRKVWTPVIYQNLHKIPLLSLVRAKHDPSLAVKPRLEAAANTKLQPSLQQQQQQQHP